MPSRVLQLAHQVEDLRLDGHIQRGGGLVGDQDLWIARQRHGDHDALAHAAGELVRIGVHATSPARGCARGAASRSPGPSASRRDSPRCKRDRLADLTPHREQRIERGHRLLKDHRDVVAADALHLGVRSAPSRSVPSKRIAPPTIRPGGSATRRRMDSAVTLLPHPDSPTTPRSRRCARCKTHRRPPARRRRG